MKHNKPGQLLALQVPKGECPLSRIFPGFASSPSIPSAPASKEAGSARGKIRTSPQSPGRYFLDMASPAPMLVRAGFPLSKVRRQLLVCWSAFLIKTACALMAAIRGDRTRHFIAARITDFGSSACPSRSLRSFFMDSTNFNAAGRGFFA